MSVMKRENNRRQSSKLTGLGKILLDIFSSAEVKQI